MRGMNKYLGGKCTLIIQLSANQTSKILNIQKDQQTVKHHAPVLKPETKQQATSNKQREDKEHRSFVVLCQSRQ